MRCLLVLLAVSSIAACGGAMSPDSAVAADAGSLGADAGSLGADAPPSDAGAKETPTSTASKQTVTFAITNGSGEDRWLVSRGVYCTASAIGGLSIAMGFTCECECPNPGSPRVESYRRLKAGETFTITWDARALVTYPEAIDCEARGWKGAPPQTVTRGVLQPVAAGTYTFTAGYESTLPARCTPSGDEATCPWMYGGYVGSLPPTIATRCESSKAATATVTLPAEGDVTVPVTID